jgi:hypothetical protein
MLRQCGLSSPDDEKNPKIPSYTHKNSVQYSGVVDAKIQNNLVYF